MQQSNLNASDVNLLHFTLGPVQDFIADARRLRDYWTGSFILSLLSGHAMAKLKEAGGEIIFPDIEGDPLFTALTNNDTNLTPYIGSLPNRFKANVSQVKGDAGEICREAILNAWEKIAAAIWDEYLEKHTSKGSKVHGNTPRDIWLRQVKNFWETAYVSGKQPCGANGEPDGSDGAWLDVRKNWRTGNLGASAGEGGDHCRMMGQFQELSGFHRTKKEEKIKQEAFWNTVSQSTGLDLQKDERLCAIAFIKRFFPVYVKLKGIIPGAIEWCPGGKDLNIKNWPSVSYIAAVPWLKTLPSEHTALDDFADTSKNSVSGGVFGEMETKLFGLPSSRFFKLDGQLFHEDGITAVVKEKLNETDSDKEPKEAIAEIRKQLSAVAKTSNKQISAATYASNFYSVLRMDGDNIGKNLQQNADLIKLGLKLFTQKVTAYFDPKHNPQSGVLVYAGGDDVLALLPVDGAIQAARDLYASYKEAFSEAAAVLSHKTSDEVLGKFTLSGSIVFAHFTSPLATVLKRSSHQLDKVAKEENGRNSLSIVVDKRGGEAASWVSRFEHAPSPLTALVELADSASNATSLADKEFGSGFFHGLKARYQSLFHDSKCKKTGFPSDNVNDHALLQKIILSELLASGISDKNFPTAQHNDTTQQELSHSVVRLLMPHGKNQDNTITFDGGLIVRFLGNERREINQ